MSLTKIHLRKLLQAFGLPENKLISLLRSDIRQEIAKENGKLNGGGDFHTPFWSDAKDFVLTGADLEQRIQSRVESNLNRKRLYPALRDGFMDWWSNNKRFSNETIEPYQASLKARVDIEGLNATVKVENLLGLSIGGDEKRLIYPYFAETPALTIESARMGLWLISEAFPKHHIADFRILDVLRGKTFSTDDCPQNGSEQQAFKYHYRRLINKWEKLKQEY